ncbi:MAG TPA: hypothetical protein VFW13_03705 [Phenylobacterium sp.]|nr:hypothetical protein [Phenylobacterium sp.]
MSEAPHDPTRRFFGATLTAVGALIFALCGLCTLTFLVASFVPQGDRSFAVMALVIGGLPTVAGYFTMRAGWRMYRTPKAMHISPGEARPIPKPPPSAPPHD